MRSAVGSTWLYGIIITFTLIFSGFLVLALTYSKAYKLKNEILTIIEKYQGLTEKSSKGDGSIPIINNYLNNSGYKAKGVCLNGEYAPESLSNTTLVKANGSKKYPYCVSYSYDKKTDKTSFTVKVFFDINLPILGNLTKYQVTGTTYAISNAQIP